MRALLLIAMVVGIAALAPQAAYASDPHAKPSAAPQAPGAKPHAASPSHAEPAGTHDAKPAAAHGKVAPAAAPMAPVPAAAETDLIALRDRIHARVAELQKSQAARKRTAPAPKTTRARRAASTGPASAPPQPRIDLVWRPSVTWPDEIAEPAVAAAAPEPDAPAAAPDRVSVSWGPEQ